MYLTIRTDLPKGFSITINIFCYLFLFRHGLSRTTIEGLRPLPEKAEEPSSSSSTHTHPAPLSYHFQRPHSLSLSSNDSSQDDKLSLSDASSLSTVRSNSSFGSIQSVRTLGNTSTGRSSVYSWGNDDVSDSLYTSIKCPGCLLSSLIFFRDRLFEGGV